MSAGAARSAALLLAALLAGPALAAVGAAPPPPPRPAVTLRAVPAPAPAPETAPAPADDPQPEPDTAGTAPAIELATPAADAPSVIEHGQHGEDGPDPSADPSADRLTTPPVIRARPDPSGAPSARPKAPPKLRATQAELGVRPPAPRASASGVPAIAPPERPTTPAKRGTPPRSTPQSTPQTALVAPGAAPSLVRLPPDPRYSPKGLCGDWRLKGEIVPAVVGPGLCGIPQPVRITEVMGVRLDPAALLNCRAARTLASWMELGPIRTAPRALGSKLAALRVAGTYSCRSRNSVSGAKLSEHSVGNAIDIRAFQLSDGREISPLRGWRKGEAGAFMLQAWRAACGPFGTVLGPDSDEHHRDHLHLDIAAHANGSYCK